MQAADRIYRRRWWTLLVLSLSLLVISLDNTILNVALPDLERDLGASASELQWIVDSYLLVFAGLLLTAGSLGDRFGHRKLLSVGLLVFGLGSALSALASSPHELIATRALMGVGGAAIMPATLSVITHVFPAGERAKAIGIWAAVSGLGIAIGPVAGGWLIEHASWSAVFWVNVPFVVAALILGPMLVPNTRDENVTRLDPVGAVLSIGGLTAMLWGVIEAPSRGWTNGSTLTAFAIAAAVLALFAVWELRSSAPMLDLRLFRNRAFSGAGFSIALVFFALMGVVFMLTQYLQSVKEYDALDAGIRILPVAAGLMLASPVSAQLAAKIGRRATVALGLTVVASGLGILSTLEVDTVYTVFAAGLFVMGTGMGLAMTPATDAIMGSLPLSKSGVGSATNDTVRQVGGAMGVAILGSILASGYGADISDATSQLPAGMAAAAEDSLGGAARVAEHLPHDAGASLLAAAQEAFVSGMHGAVLVAAAVALVGAAMAWRLMPARDAQAAAEVDQVRPATGEVALEMAA